MVDPGNELYESGFSVHSEETRALAIERGFIEIKMNHLTGVTQFSVKSKKTNTYTFIRYIFTLNLKLSYNNVFKNTYVFQEGLGYIQ